MSLNPCVSTTSVPLPNGRGHSHKTGHRGSLQPFLHLGRRSTYCREDEKEDEGVTRTETETDADPSAARR